MFVCGNGRVILRERKKRGRKERQKGGERKREREIRLVWKCAIFAAVFHVDG